MTLRAAVQGKPSSQLTLPIDRNELERKFREWLTQNDRAKAVFLRIARERVALGRRFGVKNLVEDVRWEIRQTWGADADGFKLNNSHTAYLARWLCDQIPGMAALIETRKVKA